MFAKAIKGGYAIPAFNFNNMEQLQAIIKAAVETKSPVILQVSKGARQYANQTLLRYMAEGAVQYAKELGCEKPEIVLHLDHGDSFETCKSCIDMGFSSVMIDGSHLPYDENVALTKKVVEYAHQFDVTVEGELGVLAGVKMMFPQTTIHIPSRMKWLISLRRPVATAWLFLSELLTELTNLLRNNVM
ncbi:fructose-bisphosphate aldolase class II [Bacteroides pyogenes JCM 6292]|uniref:Fructose-bisphosphate aldolase class II n=2 Tax=Bacteroides pyogenes TaxID=310300 RepID=W4PF76_9BACE|nr:fructose-bisphosphate aldolase class II [Bacteroides pyogenes JCM 6292]GAE18370.1 fructose-bisphosphate aldolase class II [Bacteroides pyogenes DSM 20611 = JCM 6294]